MSDQATGAPAPTETSAPENTSEEQSLEQDLAEEDSAEGDESSSGQEASAAPAKEAAKAADKLDAEKVPGTKKYKLVINGKEKEVTEQELIARAQKADAAEEKFQKSSVIQKQAEQLVSMVKDPAQLERLLEDPSVWGDRKKVVEFAQKILAREVDDLQKSPEVLRAEKAERELEELRSKAKKDEEARNKAEYESMVQAQEQELDQQISEAFEQSNLPRNGYMLNRLVTVMISAEQNKKELSPKQAMNIVEKEMKRELKDMFGVLPEDTIEELLGTDNIKKLRKRQIAKAKAEQATSANPTDIKPTSTAPAAPKKTDKISMKDFLRGR